MMVGESLHAGNFGIVACDILDLGWLCGKSNIFGSAKVDFIQSSLLYLPFNFMSFLLLQ